MDDPQRYDVKLLPDCYLAKLVVAMLASPMFAKETAQAVG